MAVSQRQPSLRNSKQYSIKCLLSQGTGDLVLRGSKCINLKENCPQVSGENGASGLGCGEMEVELAVNRLWGAQQAPVGQKAPSYRVPGP